MQHRIFTTLIFLSLILICTFCGTPKSSLEKTKSDPFVENLLSEMSVEEKVGQMTQVTIDMILKDDSETEIDQEKLRIAIVENKVGSILNVKGGAYSLETWHEIQNTIQQVASKETNNGIPIIYGIDAIHGMGYTQSAVLFPHNSGLAATRNLTIAKSSAKVTAMQTRASGIRWNFDPMLGVARNPLWSRFEESYGEDPFLAGAFGEASVLGYEEDGLDQITSVASCAKHYIGYSNPASGRDRTPAYIPERQLRQFYLPPFKQAIAVGAATVMVNSGEINGIPVHANSYLLKTVLREELGFDGVVVTDWEDIIRLHIRDRVASTPKEAVKMGIDAGIDMSMVPTDYSFFNHLITLVSEGEISETRLDESVRRILLLKKKLGLFDQPMVEESAIQNFDKPEYRILSLQAARESMTLLKNQNNVLPLSTSAKVLVAGPSANDVTSLHSSWSYSWQGADISKYPEDIKTIKEAIEDLVGKQNVLSFSKQDYEHPDNYSAAELTKQAKSVDAIVLCLGEKAYAESPGIITDLSLDDRQIALAEAAIATGKPLVLVLIEGRPRVISPIEPEIDGIIMAYRPSTMGAQAIAETIFGINNPSGKLPFTYPRNTNDVTMYDHKYSEEFTEKAPGDIRTDGYNPQWAFGEGMSYTQFEYTNLKLSSNTLKSDQKLILTIDVKNIGERDGSVAVEMYCRDLFASITPPMKQLKGFEKVSLEAGMQKSISFKIEPKALSFIDKNLNEVVEAGDFEVYIGTEKATFTFEHSDKILMVKSINK